MLLEIRERIEDRWMRERISPSSRVSTRLIRDCCSGTIAPVLLLRELICKCPSSPTRAALPACLATVCQPASRLADRTDGPRVSALFTLLRTQQNSPPFFRQFRLEFFDILREISIRLRKDCPRLRELMRASKFPSLGRGCKFVEFIVPKVRKALTLSNNQTLSFRLLRSMRYVQHWTFIFILVVKCTARSIIYQMQLYYSLTTRSVPSAAVSRF